MEILVKYQISLYSVYAGIFSVISLEDRPSYSKGYYNVIYISLFILKGEGLVIYIFPRTVPLGVLVVLLV